MSALPAATVEMINELSERNTHRLVKFIEALRKEEMPPTPEEIEERMAAFRRLEAMIPRKLPKDYDPEKERWEALNEKYGPLN